MIFENRRIKDNDNLPAKRTNRTNWAKDHEELVRDLSPFPITYDVDCTQPVNFSEYTYTEYLKGIYIKTQNIEINSRILEEASNVKAEKDLLKLLLDTQDKYVSINYDKKIPENVVFFVGHNMFDMIDKNIISRSALKNDLEFAIKLHPLTNDEYAAKLGRKFGWNRIIPQHISADHVIKHGKHFLVSSATELASKAIINGKTIQNCSDFDAEASGCYYSINRILFNAIENGESAYEKLNNIISCEFSGIILSIHDENTVSNRVKSFYDKSLEYRNLLSPISQQVLKNVKARPQPQKQEHHDNIKKSFPK